MADIFLSYAREDQEKVDRLAEALEGMAVLPRFCGQKAIYVSSSYSGVGGGAGSGRVSGQRQRPRGLGEQVR